MIDIASQSADALLANPRLFRPGEDAKALHRTLLKKWHPDHCSDPRANEVFAHINSQFQLAQAGEYPNTLKLLTSKGPVYIGYIGQRPFELGDVFITERSVIWRVRSEFKDLAKQFLDVSKKFKYPNDEVKGKIAPHLPANVKVLVNGDVTYVIVDRPLDYIRLADIVAKQGPLDPRHVAWCLSRAYNLAGFLHFNGITHLDVSAETMFVDPASHHGALLGGWFYSGQPKPLAAPARSSHLAKQPEGMAHGQQIKNLGRKLLGVNSVPELRALKDLPDPLKTWLMTGASGNVVRDGEDWKNALVAAFGKRRFTELKLTSKDIYT